MAKRIIPQREAWERLGIRRSKWYEDIVGKGLLRTVTLGPQSKGVLEHELDALIDQFAAQRSQVVPHGSRRRKVGAAAAATETAA